MVRNPGGTGQAAREATVWNWLAVAVICSATVIGAIALIEWIWPMFWAGVALFVAGWIFAVRTNIMGAVSEWSDPQSGVAGGR